MVVPLRRSSEVTYEVVDGMAMLLDPSGTEILTLNPVGTLVWESLDGTLDVDGLADRLLPQLTGVTREELERDIDSFVAELRSNGLLVDDAPTA